MFWGETEMGSVDRDAVGRGWGFLVAPRKEAVVGQGGHAPLGRGPRSLERFLPWLVAGKGIGASESERRERDETVEWRAWR
jgi:hypothetical protein